MLILAGELLSWTVNVIYVIARSAPPTASLSSSQQLHHIQNDFICSFALLWHLKLSRPPAKIIFQVHISWILCQGHHHFISESMVVVNSFSQTFRLNGSRGCSHLSRHLSGFSTMLKHIVGTQYTFAEWLNDFSLSSLLFSELTHQPICMRVFGRLWIVPVESGSFVLDSQVSALPQLLSSWVTLSKLLNLFIL